MRILSWSKRLKIKSKIGEKMKAKVLILTAILLFVLSSCSKLKEEIVSPVKKAKLTYKDDIKKILDENCVRCHNSSSSDFDLSTYFGIIQSGVAIPGDANSKIIKATQPGGSMRDFLGENPSVKADKIKKWVVEDSLALGDIRIHPDDWALGANSHAKFIRNTNWDLEQCKSCHGVNYQGGISKSSCYTCHNTPAGPEACNTCHGNLLNPAPPRDLNGNFSTSARGVGAHQSHVKNGNLSSAFDCSECHIKPDSLKAPGHLNGKVDVVFGDSSLARNSTPVRIGEEIVPNPIYNSEILTCSSTYCHGYFRNGNLNNAPKWNVVDGTQASCGTCHGLPPAGTHPNVSPTSCANACHNDVVELTTDGKLKIKDTSKHVNGRLSLYGYEVDFKSQKFSDYAKLKSSQ